MPPESTVTWSDTLSEWVLRLILEQLTCKDDHQTYETAQTAVSWWMGYFTRYITRNIYATTKHLVLVDQLDPNTYRIALIPNDWRKDDA